MIKKLIIFIGFACVGILTHAQNEAELSVGDTLIFDGCDSISFKYIDLYVKTRFEEGKAIDFDTLNEWAFYDAFFNTGDFDVTRLPCSYEGRSAVIKHMFAAEVPTEDGGIPKIMTVVIAMIDKGKSAAYIIEEAFYNEEVLFVPKE
jgi:aryl carrier-like protein